MARLVFGAGGRAHAHPCGAGARRLGRAAAGGRAAQEDAIRFDDLAVGSDLAEPHAGDARRGLQIREYPYFDAAQVLFASRT